MNPVALEIVALTASDGKIYPSVVVAWAQANPDSELHRRFEWDIEKAAHEHWLWQARQLISIHVVDLAGDRTTISLEIDRTRGGGYRDMGAVLSNADLRRMATEQALRELHRASREVAAQQKQREREHEEHGSDDEAANEIDRLTRREQDHECSQ